MSEEMTIDFSQAENALGIAFRDMAALTELPIQKIIRAEAGSILKACAAATKLVPPQKAELGARNAALRHLELTRGDLTINSGMHGPVGRIWKRSTGPRSNRKFRAAYGAGNPIGNPVNTHWKKSDWIDIQEAIADYRRLLEKYLRNSASSIGLARQSWIQIADSLGIALESVHGTGLTAAAIAKAREATSRTGRRFVNGRSSESNDLQDYFVDLINGLPYGERAGLPGILYRSVYGRVRYFSESLSHGVFEAMTKVAQRYPGFEITPGDN